MSKKKLLTLTDRAAELLPQLAGYHDQGAFVSKLIEDAAERKQDAAVVEQADLTTLRQLVADLMQEMQALKQGQGRGGTEPAGVQ